MSIEVLNGGSVAITGKESIALYRLLTLLQGMQLEAKGLRLSRGRSCLSIVKKEFGWRGNRAKIMALLAEEIEMRSREERT